MRLALIQDGVVVNVISVAQDTAVYTEIANIGWLYDPVTGAFSPPPQLAEDQGVDPNAT